MANLGQKDGIFQVRFRFCDQINYQDLDGYLKKRLSERHANTAERERITLMQFYKWVVQQGYLTSSPAAGLERIKGGEDRPPSVPSPRSTRSSIANYQCSMVPLHQRVAA